MELLNYMKKYKILAVTLARGGSKSIRKKNISKINGKPLLYYTIKEALKSKLISRYIVSTDDREIQKIALKYGAESPFLRPKKLAKDKSLAVDADIHALKWAEKDEGVKYDFFVELMATNPLKTYIDIDKVLKNLEINPKTFILRSSNENVKNLLKEKTNDAFNKGVFGAPTFIVNNKLYWGQDRLEYALDEYYS